LWQCWGLVGRLSEKTWPTRTKEHGAVDLLHVQSIIRSKDE
jgi:hypothetical protein